MKYYLFLPFFLAALHLSKAGPLRLQKRAAFYIANETACVVDNIVYSNGDPIPTDDPCESCKCRPPGFACVLQDCKPKPGCRAVRHLGQCCPEYVCDVPERTTLTGGNALPPANLLPGLYDESVLPVHFPSTSFPETTEKPVNPTELPVEEEEIKEKLAVEEEIKEILATEEKEPSELEIPEVEETKLPNPENTDHVPEVDDEVKQPTESESDLPKEESTGEKESAEEIKVLLNSETEIKSEDNVDVTTVKEIAEGDRPTTEFKDASTAAVPEVREKDFGTTTSSDVEIVEHEAEEITEKYVEEVPTGTELPVSENPVKNSASEKSKSLKLLDGETSDDPIKVTDSVSQDVDINTGNDKEDTTASDFVTEQPGKVDSDDAKVVDSAENKPESEDTKAEESIADPQSFGFYASDDKVVKKESAETVTIVVHVREKSKPSTVTDFVTEKVTTQSSTSEPAKEILVKSNDGVENVEIFKEPTEVPVSTGKNFEVFPSSTEISKEETITSSSEQKVEESKERSETDPIDSNAEMTTPKEESSIKLDENSATVTGQSLSEDVTEINKEARSDEELAEVITNEDVKVPEITAEDSKINKVEEEPKITEKSEDLKVTETPDEPKVVEIKVENPDVALKIEIITDSGAQTPKSEEINIEPEKQKTEESNLGENVEDITPENEPEPKSEEIPDEETTEEKVQKLEEKIEEVKVEEKNEEPQSKDEAESKSVDVEESQPEIKVEEPKPEEKLDETVEETVPEKEEDKPKESEEKVKSEEVMETKPEERAEDTDKNVEKTIVESVDSEEKKEQEQPEEIK